MRVECEIIWRDDRAADRTDRAEPRQCRIHRADLATERLRDVKPPSGPTRIPFAPNSVLGGVSWVCISIQRRPSRRLNECIGSHSAPLRSS